jgi:hypothetical protein
VIDTADIVDLRTGHLDTGCPVCGSPGERVLLTIDALAVNCSALHRSAADALAAPTGPFELTLCESCGYVRNRAFDADLLTYDDEYENALDFSPRFRAYRDALADELVERHALVGGEVVEIGCGQGAFLASLCRDGRARGIGYDPTHRPGDETLPATVHVVPSLFDPTTGARGGDLLCARHVLEHLPDPLAFLRELRLAVSAMYLEVPAGDAVLGGDGCWDLVYQHVSYFSAPTLHRLLATAGYRVSDLRMRFGDQYLSIEAGATAMVSPPPVEPFVARAVAGAAALRARIAAARDAIAAAHDRGERVAIWGAGAKATTFLSLVGTPGVDVAVDLNPRKVGTFLAGSGVEVTNPRSLVEVEPSLVFIFNPVYRDEITDSLAAMGLHPEVRIP